MTNAGGKLDKELYLDINKLRRLNLTTEPKFILESQPFNSDDEEEASATSKDIIVTGRIFPNSDIYKNGSYKIEMKLTPTFPFDPPEVRFLTKIYHPNVGQDGKLCHELLNKKGKWSAKISLVDVVKAVTTHVDEPNIDYALSLELGREYMSNRDEFNRKATDFVKQYALPRS
ncbi:unnamed protein product [Adineta steineri]|uniref:UBC core domain-containing protein n=1 Tax=Adineta steineri TaxID=433720 RepID=A0A814ALV6_9BILA|nr:unnamed protein product [Adineta steineri]CAF0915289.1 unnamed protein product [Adineta steineri]CAF3671416.1 unnamed protein product [Adineta steineri]CAF3906534.1 unnamed protein product [Adineta steineri]